MPGSHTEAQKRRRPLERSVGVRVTLQPRDFELLELFLSFRLATTATLFPLLTDHFPRPFVLWRRLNRLFHAGYLARPSAQQLRVFAKRGGPLHVYALGNRGAAELRAHGFPVSDTDFDQKAAAMKSLTFDHALLTTHAVAVLLAALRRHPSLTVRRVLPDGAFRTAVVASLGRRDVRLPINPDSVLVVDEQEPPQTTALVIEADRDTMPGERTALTQSAFFKKALAYYTYWQEKARLRTELEADDFVVLTIAETPQRLEALCAIARQVDPQKRGTGIFWFTTVDALRLDDPAASLAGPIWTTAAADTGALF